MSLLYLNAKEACDATMSYEPMSKGHRGYKDTEAKIAQKM